MGTVDDEELLSHELRENKPQALDDFVRLGRYCVLVLVMAEIVGLNCIGSMTYMIYAGASPKMKSCGETEFGDTNLCLNLEGLQRETNCTPVIEFQFRSINIDFDLLCEKGHQVKNSISIQMFGVLIGAAVFGQASDLYGRRRMMIISSIGVSIFCTASAFFPVLLWFTILRTITGFFTGGLVAVQGVYLIENIPKMHRMWIQTVIAWSPNFILFPYLAYLAGDWKTLAIVNGIVSTIGLFFILMVHESPRWLIQKGRMDDARVILEKIRRIDGNVCADTARELERTLLNEQQLIIERGHKKSRYTFIHLFCTKALICRTVVLLFGITSTSLTNYALLYNLEKLSGSIYWNSAIFGIVRWIAGIVIALADFYIKSFGRCLLNQASLIVQIMVFSGMSYAYYNDGSGTGGWVIRIGTITAMCVCSQLFLAKYMIANELYPTAVRNLAVSLMSTCSRIGTIFAPQLFYLSEYSVSLPYMVLATACSVDFILFQIIVPETKGKALENHLPPKEERLFGKSLSTTNNMSELS